MRDGLWDEPVARNTDPDTSWEAARSIPRERIRRSQQAILTILQWRGPSTDEGIWDRLARKDLDAPRMSPSGARTRRSELVAMGKVRDSGKRERLQSGRQAIVWEAVG